ncbi:MAG: response regulator transcription factor [Bacteroidetes bacterium]|nr:response regulator transcription factor [Bacteroidota bacterium]
MNKIRCLIIDDEPPALDLLESYVSKTDFLVLSGRCTDAYMALKMLDQQPVDLLFLDIHMPDLNGIELSRVLSPGIRIIFTTAFQQYAMDGYKVDALDYLLKPFNFEEFQRAANKALEWFRVAGFRNEEPDREPFIFIRSGGQQVKIYLKQVMYFESQKDYIKIFKTDGNPPILSLMRIKQLEDKLPQSRFLKIHRSFIINLDHINAIERGQVLIGKERITVADQYLQAFHSYVASHMIRT